MQLPNQLRKKVARASRPWVMGRMPLPRCARLPLWSLLFACALLLLGVSAPVRAAAKSSDPAFADVVPEETLFYAQARNLTQLREAWVKTPFYQLWKDPKLDVFLKPSRERVTQETTQLEQKTGMTLDEMKKTFPGEIALFVSDLRYSNVGTVPTLYMEVNTGMMTRIAGDQAKITRIVEEQILKDIPKSAERSSETFRGVKIFTTVYKEALESAIPEGSKKQSAEGVDSPPAEEPLKIPDAAAPESSMQYHYEYAFIDDVFILLEGQRAYMKKIVSNYLDAKAGSKTVAGMGATANYKSAFRSLAATPDLTAYVNLERLIKQAGADPDMDWLVKPSSLKLDELKSVAVAVALGPKDLTIDAALSCTPQPQGVASFLVNEQSNPFRSRKMVPKDVVSYSGARLDLGGLFEMVRKALVELSPQESQNFEGGLTMMSTMAQVDLADLIKKVGGEWAVYSRPKGGAEPVRDPGAEGFNSTYIIGLKSEENFADNLNKAIETMAGIGGSVKIEPTDFKGFKVYTLRATPASEGGAPDMPPGQSPEFSFAVANSFLIISGDAEEVREVIRHSTGDAEGDVTQNDDFRRTKKQVKEGYVGISWSNMSKNVGEIVRSIQSPASPLSMVLGSVVQVSAMPGAETFSRYFDQTISASYVNKNGLFTHAIIAYPEGLKSGK